MRLPLTEDSVSTQFHHLVLLNKEKNKNPKKFATKKKQFNIVAVWFFKYLCAVMAGFGPANLQRDKLAS